MQLYEENDKKLSVAYSQSSINGYLEASMKEKHQYPSHL